MTNANIADFLNNESYKDFFDNAHDLTQIVDLEGRVVYANKSWTGVLEYSLEEIQGQSIYAFIHEDDWEKYREYRTRIISGHSPNKEIIIRFHTRSGRSVFLEGFISVGFKNKRPYYTRGIFRDITSKLEKEDQLKEREYNLKHLLINAPDAVIVIDRDSVVTFWNPQAEKMFGWKAQEVINQPLSGMIIPPQHREAHDRGMKRYLATGEAHVLNKTIEITAIDKTGDEFFVSLSISTTTQNGKIAFVAFLRDIREQKAVETELANKRQELERSNQQLEQFAHVASHDMKEPLRKVKMFSKLLEVELGPSVSENGQIYLQKINSACDRLQSMVDGVLNYAIAGNTSETFEDVDLNVIMQTIKDDLELLIQQKRATIQYDSLGLVYGAPFLIYQLLYNLLNNSLKFSKEDEPAVITIQAREIRGPQMEAHPGEDDSRLFVEVKVQDNGIGFDPQYAAKIFETFTRLNSRSSFEGTGLGLSLCKKIMDRHNGFIRAEGKEGMGATMFLFFPVPARVKGTDMEDTPVY